MPLSESRKKSVYKWRETHTEEYLTYINAYYKEYRKKNLVKENLRMKLHHRYKKECLRMRNILIDI